MDVYVDFWQDTWTNNPTTLSQFCSSVQDTIDFICRVMIAIRPVVVIIQRVSHLVVELSPRSIGQDLDDDDWFFLVSEEGVIKWVWNARGRSSYLDYEELDVNAIRV